MSDCSSKSATALLLAVALAGCSGERSEDMPRLERQAATTANAAPETGVPRELSGTWRTSLKRSELVTPPADLKKPRSSWKLKFLATGGVDNGPSMFVSNEELGDFGYSAGFAGDRIDVVHDDRCKAFSYAVDDGELTLQSVESGCPTKELSSVLTARAWQRMTK